MNINKFKKPAIIIASIFVGIYALFLLLPFIITPIINSYSGKISEIIKDSTGYETKIEGLGVSTSPNLSAGLRAKKFSLFIPGEENAFFRAEDFKLRLSLIPLFRRKIKIGDVTLDSLEAYITVKKDGSFLLFDYLKQHEKKEGEVEESISLPWGFELSNTLPNVKIDDYKFAFVELSTGKSYSIEGEDLHITDFVLDKHVKVSTKGKIVFENSIISNFDIKIYNKIMPDLKLQDLVFPKEAGVEVVKENQTAQSFEMPFNIIDIFKSINNNQLRANVFMDVKTSGTFKEPNQKGHFKIEGLTVAVNGKPLPESYADLKFKGSKTDIDSVFFTSNDEHEKTQLIGTIRSGKKPAIDLTLRSNAKINNIIRLIDSVALSFGVEDFKTISATGGIDADFNINSDLKKVSSNGYLKVNPSSVKYGLYNVSVDNITADVSLDNNNINIKNSGFSVMGHPLKLTGTIKSDAQTDLKLTADNLSIKGLLAAAGQKTLLKENNFNGGALSVTALVKGKLNDLKPDVALSAKGVDILNKPSNLRVLLSNALIKLVYNNNAISGDIDLNNMSVKNPAASVSVPKAKIVMDTKNINIQNSYLLVNNSRVDVKGSVKDYMTDKLNMNITAKGNLNSADVMAFIPKELHSMFPYAGTMPLSIVVTGDAKTQNISADLSATPTGYIRFADINLLKGKTTNIHSDIKYSNDTLSFSNSSIKTGSTSVASLSGNINKLASNPRMNLNINVPNHVSFPIWGMGTSNITASGSIDVAGSFDNPQVKGNVNIPDISIKDMDFAITNLNAKLNGNVLNGSATADKFKFGGIVMTKLTSDFSLKDYTDFYLTNMSGDAFSGKVNGKISYSIPTTAIGVCINGKSLNSTDAVYGAVGIKNALTGTMGFDANLSMRGVTDKEIINSMKGNINFNIDDGRFMSIGRLENLVAAQNVESNSILKAAISPLSTLSTVQETDKFKSISGNMNFSGGNANISKINVSGPLMSYYVKGSYYILQNTANLVILGRLDSKVVSVLGVVGQLSADKLLAYIPKIGAATSQILQKLTEDPANENTSLIPALSSGSTNYKDFKVIFNGPVEKSSSVRTFKWLSKCDTSQINVKQDIQNAKEAIQTNINNTITEKQKQVENIQKNVTNIVETQKQKVEETKKSIEQTKTDIQNIKQNAGQSASNLGKLFMNAVQNANKTIPQSTNSGSTENAAE